MVLPTTSMSPMWSNPCAFHCGGMADGSVASTWRSSSVRARMSVEGIGEFVPERIHPPGTRPTPWLNVAGSDCSDCIWARGTAAAVTSSAAPSARVTTPAGTARCSHVVIAPVNWFDGARLRKFVHWDHASQQGLEHQHPEAGAVEPARSEEQTSEHQSRCHIVCPFLQE